MLEHGNGVVERGSTSVGHGRQLIEGENSFVESESRSVECENPSVEGERLSVEARRWLVELGCPVPFEFERLCQSEIGLTWRQNRRRAGRVRRWNFQGFALEAELCALKIIFT